MTRAIHTNNVKNVQFFWDVTVHILVNISGRLDGMQFSPWTVLPVALNIRKPSNLPI
jgi:hypothetical protein